MYLKELEIRGFQIHKYISCAFTKGLNVIVGSTDKGKSSILRALLWVIKNRPTGDSIRNWYIKEEEPVMVSVCDDNNNKVVKVRENKKSWYELNNEKFEALKTEVPIEVEDFFNISDFNIQTQHDPYCLINDSPGARAEKLNKLVGLNVIDITFKNLNSRISNVKILITEKERKIDEHQKEIESFDYLVDVESLLTELAKEVSSFSSKETECQTIKEVLLNLSEIEAECSSLNLTINWDEFVCDLLSEITNFQRKEKDLITLKNLISVINDYDKNIESETDWLTIEERKNELLQLIKKYETEESMVLTVQILIKTILMSEKDETKEREGLISKQMEFKSLLKKNKVCPFCTQILSDKIIEKVSG